MTREQNIEAIRAACIAANREIDVCVDDDCTTRRCRSRICRRPIRLADVLLAIAEATLSIDAPYVIDSAGQFYDLGEQEDVNYLKYVKATWNLRADTLEGQTDECLAFLASLLK